MKKILNTQCFAVLSLCIAISFSSCTKLETEIVSNNRTITIEFQQVDPEDSTIADDATRTEFHNKTIWWSKGDKVRFFQYASVNGAMKCVTTSTTLTSAKESLSVSVSSFNTPDEGTDSYYFAIFPYSSYSSYGLLDGHVVAKINTPDTQTPTATSFDPAAACLSRIMPRT